jgi:hypothetical protein
MLLRSNADETVWAVAIGNFSKNFLGACPQGASAAFNAGDELRFIGAKKKLWADVGRFDRAACI